jgi:uncharacterized protein YciI
VHYLLFYEKVDGFAEKQIPYQNDHRDYVMNGLKNGGIILAGNLGDPTERRALLLFDCDSAASAEKFAQNDPYVIHGIVNNWYVKSWTTLK